MTPPERILLDQIISQKTRDAGADRDRGEVFELLALEQALKDYDLSRDDIETGWVDGARDGGVDGFYIFLNGRPSYSISPTASPKHGVIIDVHLVTARHHDTFSMAPLTSMVVTVSDVLDMAKERRDLVGRYSDDILGCRDEFCRVMETMMHSNPRLRFHIAYCTRGDASSRSHDVSGQMKRLEAEVKRLFSFGEVDTAFLGCAELLRLYRKERRTDLSLRYKSQLTQESESYVLLCRLDEYAKFLTDEDGRLRRYLFDSNVRDYLGLNSVNTDIMDTLLNSGEHDFWWLNNGITILATAGRIVGSNMQLSDVQIVNGLQTSETIFDHFAARRSESAEKCVLIRIVISTDDEVRDRIIRATNNQSSIQILELHATEPVQRNIEDVLRRDGWAYERRQNDHRNTIYSPERRVSMLYAAGAVLAIVLRMPEPATRLKSRRLRRPDMYQHVFNESMHLNAWSASVAIVKRVEAAMPSLLTVRGTHVSERFITVWRNPVAFMVVASALGLGYSIEALYEYSRTRPTVLEVADVWGVVGPIMAGEYKKESTRWSILAAAFRAVGEKHGFQMEAALRKSLPAVPEKSPRPTPEELVRVNDALPEQPWKVGVHNDVARALRLPPPLVKAAIRLLIESGKRKPQRGAKIV